MELEWISIILLVATGLAAGVLGGLLGIGGSVIMIPAMVAILGSTRGGIEQIHQYMTAAMIVNFLLAVPSAVAHVRNKAVWPKVWAPMAIAAIVGSVLGVQLGYFVFAGEMARLLRWGLAAFLVYVIVQNTLRLLRPRKTEGLDRRTVERRPIWHKAAIGLPMGFSAGLLGVGGGAFAVPAQQVILRMPLKNAIATSAAVIASTAWFGAIFKNVGLGEHGTVARSLTLAACLAPTAMIGGYLGGNLTHKLPTKVVRVIFIVLMIVASYKLFVG